jgi:hypothetical protein
MPWVHSGVGLLRDQRSGQEGCWIERYGEVVAVVGGTRTGMMSSWPTLRESGLANSLASTMASTVTLYFRAMLDRISPLSTVCVIASAVAVAVGVWVGAGVAVGAWVGAGIAV